MSNDIPAFPVAAVGAAGDLFHIEGMTLRDWFAGQLIAGGYVNHNLAEWDLEALFGKHRTGIKRGEIIAADAYRLADAMLAARTALTTAMEGEKA